MDDKRREFIYHDGAELYLQLKKEIEDNPKVHYNKKYKMGVSNLHSLLEKAQDEFNERKNKIMNRNKFFSKLPINIPVSADELDSVLGKVVIQATQLRTCSSCKCLHCEKDNCKASCFICQNQAYVKYCDDVCIRRCENWNIILQNEKYSVDYMAYVFKSEHFYLFIHRQKDTQLKPMVYNQRAGTVKYPQQENASELQKIVEVLNSFNSC